MLNGYSVPFTAPDEERRQVEAEVARLLGIRPASAEPVAPLLLQPPSSPSRALVEKNRGRRYFFRGSILVD
ncbi:MAG: hypothetical protein ACRDQZ_02405 [Mycobacteriales bacterium]